MNEYIQCFESFENKFNNKEYDIFFNLLLSDAEYKWIIDNKNVVSKEIIEELLKKSSDKIEWFWIEKNEVDENSEIEDLKLEQDYELFIHLIIKINGIRIPITIDSEGEIVKTFEENLGEENPSYNYELKETDIIPLFFTISLGGKEYDDLLYDDVDDDVEKVIEKYI